MMMVTPHQPYQACVGLQLPLSDFGPWGKHSESDVQDKRPFGSLMDFPWGAWLHMALPTYLSQMANCPQRECLDSLNPIMGGWKTTAELG